jgi:hypothetical protein
MKKLLGTTLALAMFVPAGANAELLKNFKVGGQLDIQTTSARNITDFTTRGVNGAGVAPGAPTNNDRIGAANTRIMLKADWDLLDDVHSHVTLVKGASNHVARVYGGAADSAQDVQANSFVEEANVKIDKVFGLLDLTAGRQFYGEEGDLVVYFGPRDNYGLTVAAIDAFRADWNGEHMSVTGIAGRTSDAGVGGGNGLAPNDGTTVPKVDLRGVVLSCKMHEMIKPSIYVYNQVTHATGALGFGGPIGTGAAGGKNSNLWVGGVKAKVAIGGLSLHLEVAGNRGEDRSTTLNTSFKGWAFLGKAAYKLDLSDLGMITPWGEYGYGTGDSNGEYAGNRTFQSINTDYRPGGIYGRFDRTSAVALGSGAGVTGNALGSNGLSNRIIWGVGIKATPTMVNKLTVGASFWRYAFNRLPNIGTTGNARNNTRNSRNIGSEVDVTAEWKHSENVSLKATAGSFKPGAGIADIRGANAALNPAVMLAGDVSVKF